MLVSAFIVFSGVFVSIMTAGRSNRITAAMALAGVTLQCAAFGLRVFWLPLERRASSGATKQKD